MFISKIHLQGFKSFLYKTDLKFGPGVTAVVGPNGCGKSNIVDAIRWVLGEQKTSLLRSVKMEDIIFNGTKNKKALSFCEASMLINNNMNILPMEYRNVEILRRLYRNGESEYYINKTLCRLKDIQNLFIDTGMSSNAYSVIELKMVDTILSNNAEERRQMFEEAAGINHYKQQRMAALKKMHLTQSDMERINDIMVEVNNNIKSLKLKIIQYVKCEKLNKKQKDLNIKNAQAEIQIIKEKQVPKEQKLNNLRGIQARLSGQMNIDEELIEKSKKDYEKHKLSLNNIQETIINLENSISKNNSDLIMWSEKKIGNDNQYKHFNDELQHNNSNFINLKKKIKELNSKKNKLRPEILARKKIFDFKDINLKKSILEFENIQSKLDIYKKEKETIFLKKHEEINSLEKIKIRLNEKMAYKENLNEKIDTLNYKLGNSQVDFNLFKANIDKHDKSNRNLLKIINDNKNKHSNMLKSIRKYKDEHFHQVSKQATISSQIKFYKSLIDNHVGPREGLENILSKLDLYPSVLGVLADLIEVDIINKPAIDVALGEYNEYLVVNSKIDAEKLILDSSHRLSIFSLDSVPKIELNIPTYPSTSLLSLITCSKEIKQLLEILIGDVYLLDENKKYPENNKLDILKWVTRSGEYYFRGFIHKTTGTINKLTIGRKTNLEILQKEYNNVSKHVLRVQKEYDAVIEKSDIISDELQILSIKLEEGFKYLHADEQEMSQQDYIILHQQKEIEDLKLELKNNDKELIGLNTMISKVNKTIQLYNLKYEESEREYDAYNENIVNIRILRNKQQKAHQEVHIRLLEFEKEEEGLIERLEILKSQEKEIKGRIKKYQFELSRIHDKNKSLSKSIYKVKNELNELNHLSELKNGERTELEKLNNIIYETMQRLQLGIRERHKLKEEQLSKISEYEISFLEDENSIKHVRLRIKELYNKEISDAPINLINYDLEMKKVEIAKIQMALDRIGPVNHAVNQEYKEETERFNFLSEQYKDLKESEKQINQMIVSLDEEANSKFIKTFNLIQEHFKKTYSSFFNGGTGNLKLIGEDDPLEGKIKIIAQPPGKKNQALRMLSAGEKALTAIALLFAIYLVKPSPFCILDEVDAPLDDTNIRKFVGALNNYSNKTQFIVVTHNKLTMEKADYIYGITQEEEGVSKIVSVNIKNGE